MRACLFLDDDCSERLSSLVVNLKRQTIAGNNFYSDLVYAATSQRRMQIDSSLFYDRSTVLASSLPCFAATLPTILVSVSVPVANVV